jgi:hypothetical protein
VVARCLAASRLALITEPFPLFHDREGLRCRDYDNPTPLQYLPYHMIQPDRGIGKILIVAVDKNSQLMGLNTAGQAIGSGG